MQNNCNTSRGCFCMYCLSVQYNRIKIHFGRLIQKIFCLTLENHEFLLMLPSIIKANVSNKLCLPNIQNRRQLFCLHGSMIGKREIHQPIQRPLNFDRVWILTCLYPYKKEYFLINYLERQRRKSEHLIAWKVIYILSQTRIESM